MTDPSKSLVLAPTDTLALSTVLPSGQRLVQAFLRGRSPRTLLAYRKDLEDFALFLGLTGDRALDEAAGELLRRGHGGANELALGYQDHLLQRKLSPATINRRLAALRSLVHVAKLLDLVTWSLEVENLKGAKYRDTRGPGENAVVQMFAQVGERNDLKGLRDQAIVHLLFDLALRRGEVASLDLKHLDLASGTLSILGKGRRERETVRLPAPTRGALAAFLAMRGGHEGALFFALDPKSFGHRLTGAAIYQIVRDVGAKVGVQTRPHGLRHTAITAALEMTNGNMRNTQRFSRHADPRTLQIYDDNRTDMAGQVASMVAESIASRRKAP